MGSFSVTDALTRMPIVAGDKVMLVHTLTNPHTKLYPDYMAHTYQLGLDLWRFHQLTKDRLEQCEEWEDTIKAVTDKDPDSTLAVMLRNLFAPPQLEYVAVLGSYDDYGWLELSDGTQYKSGQPTKRQIEQPEYKNSGWDQRLPDEHFFFVKQGMLSTLFLEGAEITEDNKYTVLKDLADFSHTVRAQLFGNTHSLLGAQFPDREELMQHRKLLDAIEAEMEGLQERLNREEEENA